MDFESETFIAHTLRGDGFDASEDGTGRGTPIIPILEAGARTGLSTTDARAGIGIGDPDDPMFTLQSGKQHAVAYRTAGDGAVYEEGAKSAPLTTGTDQSANILAFQSSQSGTRLVDAHATLDANNGSRRHNGVVSNMAVRRLTPRECERLQGMREDYTLIPWRGKPADQCPDGPRYKAIGNSMAVPVVRWIFERIEHVRRVLP